MFKRLRNKFLLMNMILSTVLILIFLILVGVAIYLDFDRKINDVLTVVVQPGQSESVDFGGPVIQEGPFRMPDFTVWLDGSKNIARIEAKPNFDTALSEHVARVAIDRNAGGGYIDYSGRQYWYKLIGDRMTFADISIEVETYKRLATVFLWFIIPALIAIFLMSLFFSNKAIAPIEIAFNKQKEFIADASHELKTPLATISTNVDVLMDLSNKEQKHWLSHIQSESKRMNSLINGLIYMTKMEYAEQERSEQIDFSRLVKEVLLPLEAVFYEKNIILTTAIVEGIEIVAQRESMQKLVGILLDNAIKYSTGTVNVTLEKANNTVIFSVANSYPGILDSEIARIWDRFYRGDKSREYTGGFGIGLSLAKTIVARQGGKLTCDSQKDGLTTFKFTTKA